MTLNALLVSPSRGLGGGIERYVSAVGAAFELHGVSYRRVDLRTTDRPASLGSKLRLMASVKQIVRASDNPVRLVLAHRNLLPVIYPAARVPGFAGAAVILHGDEAWSSRRKGGRAMRRSDVRVVAASSFTAGALAPLCQASVLHPGVSADWYPHAGRSQPAHAARYRCTQSCDSVSAGRLAKQGSAHHCGSC